jgi:DNA-binding LacI/PurR family transcriptional regulator
MPDNPSVPTIRDVAALAGVSIAAVSRFTNHKQRFTPEVERRIAAAITALGYQRNAAARSMATGRSGAVAALVAGVDNPHTAALVKGLCRVALAEGFDVLFFDTQHSTSPQFELERAMGMQVDGLLLAAPMPLGTGELLARYGRPFVDLTRRDSDSDSRSENSNSGNNSNTDAAADPTANADINPRSGDSRAAPGSTQEAAGALLGRFLLRSGHRRITYIACAAQPSNAERLRGLSQALAAAGLQLVVCHASAATAEGGAEVASSVLLAANRPDAVVTCNDQVAMGLLSEAQVLGVSVPGDVSVAGIENAPFGRYLLPALTSVELHADERGAQAMRRLSAAIRGEALPPSAPPLEPRLVVRDSTRSTKT